MKISYQWLKDYAGFSESPEELAVLLTDCGLEVESLEKFESVRGGLKGVVTGEVLSCERHPDADRLTLTRVNAGLESSLPIVCGAPNVEAGQKVLVALVGAVLHTPGGDLEIKKTKIRGQVSEGMICAEDELQLGTSHDGIMVLPEDTPVGIPAADYFQLKEDWVFEIGLTPNRVDAASHLGVARDIVAVLNHRRGSRQMQVLLPDISSFSVDDNNLPIPVLVEDPGACPRYCGLTISGLKVEESPDWLKFRLRAIGLKPINNVVDITNFVLHELGQPLHAFDARHVDGNQVIVKKSPMGTSFETLDEETLELSGEDLMICNASEPMCMAGILGGIRSGVTRETTGIFLESAYFSPTTIRRSSNRYGIKTDASFRFERGADPEMTAFALKRAALLIREIAGGKISSQVVDVYPRKINPATLTLDLSYATRLIGKEIPSDEIKGILLDLEMEILEQQEGKFILRIPAYRVDVTRPADVVEEILRIYGYNKVDLPDRLYSSIVLSPKPDKEKLQNVVSDLLSSRGFTEIMNNSLTKGSYFESDGFDPGSSVRILNPLSQDLNVLRQSLLFGGLETVAFNQNRQLEDMKLYEFGNIYLKQDAKAAGSLGAYGERMALSLFLTGRRYPETWQVVESPVGFYDLKSAVFAVFGRIGLDAVGLEMEMLRAHPLFEFGVHLVGEDGNLSTMGLLAKSVTRRFDIRNEVYFATLEWDRIMHLSDKKNLLFREIPKFPEVRRDLALLIGKEVPFSQIEKLAFETTGNLLKQVKLFDVYQDEKLGMDKKSYAVSFVLQDQGKTLTDKEIDSAMNKLADVYVSQLNAVIR
jgi:phenylalanyl-tRNA synthetase beta chain